MYQKNQALLLQIFLEKSLELVKDLSEEQSRSLLGGEFKLQVVFDKKKENSQSSSSKPSNTKVVDNTHLFSTLRDTLLSLEKREDGLKHLRKTLGLKKELLDFCKFLDVPTTRKDKMERLEEKIIESTIGYRIRSKVVQGRTQ